MQSLTRALIKPKPSAAASAPVLALLSYASQLDQTSPRGREQAVRAARRRVHDAPGAMAYARLALALGSPHQHLYTPDGAARYAKLALNGKKSPWGQDARQYLRDQVRLYRQLTERDQDQKRTAELNSRLHKAQRKLKALSKLEDRLDNVENNP